MFDAAGADHSEFDRGHSLLPTIEGGSDARDAQLGRDVVFSEVNLYSTARTERVMTSIDSQKRKPLEFYDLVDDPNELRKVVKEQRHLEIHDQFHEEYFSHRLADLNVPQLKLHQDGDILTNLHQEYPEY